jgi:hypothetical protein
MKTTAGRFAVEGAILPSALFFQFPVRDHVIGLAMGDQFWRHRVWHRNQDNSPIVNVFFTVGVMVTS